MVIDLYYQYHQELIDFLVEASNIVSSLTEGNMNMSFVKTYSNDQIFNKLIEILQHDDKVQIILESM